MVNIILISCGVLYGFVYLVLAAKTGKPFKTILLYAAIGMAGLFAVNFTARYSGITLPLNAWTLGTGAALGLPGTVGLMLLRIIFQ